MTSVKAEIIYILENSYSTFTWKFCQTGQIYFETFELISYTYVKQANQIPYCIKYLTLLSKPCICYSETKNTKNILEIFNVTVHL